MAEACARGQGLAPKLGARKWLGVALTVLLAACQIVPKGPPRPVGPPPPREVERPEPAGPLPTDTERHRVALLVPLTGANAGVGTSISNAANLAVLDTGGKNIRITMYDTAPGAAAAARQAIAEGNRIILGPLLAEDVRAVAPVARAARVPLIAFSNDTAVAGNGTFVMGYAPAQSIARIIDYARGKGITKFAGLVPAGLYGQRASTALLREVEASGGQVVSVQTFDRSAGSMKLAISRMSQASPYEAVLIADSGRSAIQAAPLIRARAGGARLLGTELWNTDTALGSAPALRGAWFASVSDGLYKQLATKYRARFGRSPYRLASLGYDAVLLVTRIAGDWRIGSTFPIGKLSDPGGFSGIDGAFRFTRDSIAERALEVQQAGPGGFTIVSPAPRGF